MQHDFILLDRSGSMVSLWTEALSSVNGYVKKLADEKVDTGVTLVTFDSPEGKMVFDVIRDRIIPSTWREVTKEEASPRGFTPLNDAVGKIVDRANAGAPNGQKYDKVAIIIMTDGQENASRELDVNQAKKLLDDCRAKGWQVVFLGANFDNAAQAASYNTQSQHTVRSTAANLRQTMSVMASKRAVYGSAVAGSAEAMTSMDWGDDEKQKAATDKP